MMEETIEDFNPFDEEDENYDPFSPIHDTEEEWDLDYEYGERVEFPIDEENDFVSLFFDLQNDKWGYWYIDDEGQEEEKFFDSFDSIQNGVQIYDKMVSQEEITEYKNIIDSILKNSNEGENNL